MDASSEPATYCDEVDSKAMESDTSPQHISPGASETRNQNGDGEDTAASECSSGEIKDGIVDSLDEAYVADGSGDVNPLPTTPPELEDAPSQGSPADLHSPALSKSGSVSPRRRRRSPTRSVSSSPASKYRSRRRRSPIRSASSSPASKSSSGSPRRRSPAKSASSSPGYSLATASPEEYPNDLPPSFPWPRPVSKAKEDWEWQKDSWLQAIRAPCIRALDKAFMLAQFGAIQKDIDLAGIPKARTAPSAVEDLEHNFPRGMRGFKALLLQLVIQDLAHFVSRLVLENEGGSNWEPARERWVDLVEHRLHALPVAQKQHSAVLGSGALDLRDESVDDCGPVRVCRLLLSVTRRGAT